MYLFRDDNLTSPEPQVKILKTLFFVTVDNFPMISLTLTWTLFEK